MRLLFMGCAEPVIDMTAQIANPEIQNVGQHHGHIELADDGLCHRQCPGDVGDRDNIPIPQCGLSHETEIVKLVKFLPHVIARQSPLQQILNMKGPRIDFGNEGVKSGEDRRDPEVKITGSNHFVKSRPA